MQRRSRSAAVLARSEDHHKPARVQIGARETPLGQIARFVRQIPAVHVHRAGAGVEDLDPVFISAVLVRQGVRIVRHELGDDHLARGAGAERQSQGAKKEWGRQLSHC